MAHWHETLSSIAAYAQRVLLGGRPGTGKTHAGENLGFGLAERGETGRVFRVTLNPDLSMVDLLGCWINTDSGFRWNDNAPAVQALECGGVLLLDEIDAAGSDLEVALHALTEDKPRVTLASGRVVTAAPGYSVVATTNADFLALRPALLDRFPVRLVADQFAPGLLERFPESVRNILTACEYEHGNPVCSSRAWLAWQDLARHVDRDVAGEAVFGARWETVADSLAAAS